MAYDIEVSKAQMAALTDGYTGHDLNESNIYPSVLNVLQSDKQYDAFSDGDSITKAMYGKVFIRTDENTTKDLKDSIEGTILKIERGFEIRENDGKIIDSGHGFLDNDKKKEFLTMGLRPKNMVKVLLSTYSYEKTMEMMTAINEGKENLKKGDYPFCIVVVKGSSFGSWFDVEDGMKSIAKEVYDKPISNVAVPSFKLEVSGEKFSSDEYGDYYGFKFDVKPNDPDDAVKFMTFAMEMKDFSMFYKVADKTNEAIDKTFEGLDGEPIEGEVVEGDKFLDSLE